MRKRRNAGLRNADRGMIIRNPIARSDLSFRNPLSAIRISSLSHSPGLFISNR